MAKFKTRARALDMLGKQQIAGIPTAISELFKNAYDAYATIARVDFLKPLDMFVLSDNGIGMTKNDFEHKWLALGTDSKYSKKSSIIPAKMKERPVLGEKGIGRLAISTIGPQVLIMTRAKRDNQLEDIVISYIHWGVFEIPGINLEDINIPVKSIPNNSFPNKKDIDDLVNDFRLNIEKFKDILTEKQLIDFYNDFENLRKKSELELLTKKIGEPTLKNASGTQFFITPVSELLSDQIEDWDNMDKDSQLRQTLVGFYNTMTCPISEQEMNTEFNVYNELESSLNLLEDSRFWTQEDFLNADVYFSGKFDSYGVFNGKIRIYGYEQDYSVKCTNRINPLSCGEFKFTLGFIPGELRNSLLDTKIYNDYNERLKAIGAIYIYRDNIRILPYGTPEFDFLKLEAIRSKRASDFLFSHRRLFATIELTNEFNYMLKEKAGREGFIENKAYTEFKEVLTNLLFNIMTDFLKNNAKVNNTFELKKNELLEIDKRNKALQVQDKKNKQIIRDFKNLLGKKEKELFSQGIKENYTDKIKYFYQVIDENYLNNNFDALLFLKTEILQYSNDYWAGYKMAKPRGIILPEEVDERLGYYIAELEELLEYNNKEINKLISCIDMKLNNLSDIKLKTDSIKNSIDEQLNFVKNIVVLKNSQIEEIYLLIKRNLDMIISKATIPEDTKLQEIENSLINFKEQLQYDINIKNNLIKNYTKEIEEVKNNYNLIFEKIKYAMANSLSLNSDNQLLSSEDLLEAYETEIRNYQKNAETDLELLQKGLAIDVINHEFNNNIKFVRNNIKNLRVWAEHNASLMQLYNNIYNGFMHLDGYLALFTKLQRRLYRNAIEISGNSILRYIEDIFKEQFAKFQINLIASDDFRANNITGFPSTFYPVFINLLDNSIYWLKSATTEKNIYLEIDSSKNWVIRDNGPGIKPQDVFRIFEKGFSRKEMGRGLGLYICKEVLTQEGYDIVLDQTYTDGAKFIITKIKED